MNLIHLQQPSNKILEGFKASNISSLPAEANKFCVKPKLDLHPTLANWAQVQSSNWLQCTLTKSLLGLFRNTPIKYHWLNLAQNLSETTSWLRFACILTVSRPLNSLCNVLSQLSLTVLVCYRCRSRIMHSLTSSLPRTLSCTLKRLDSNKFGTPILEEAPSKIRNANGCTVYGFHPLWLNHLTRGTQLNIHLQLVQVNGTCMLG